MQIRRMLGIGWVERRTTKEILEMVGETVHLAKIARIRRLNFAFHVLRHDSVFLHTLNVWNAHSRNRLPKRTWLYEVQEDIRIVCNASGETYEALLNNKVLQKTVCETTIQALGPTGRYECHLCAKPFTTIQRMEGHKRKVHTNDIAFLQG